MADRVTVTTGTVVGLQSPPGPRASRFVIAGQTQFGPTDAPRVVRNMRDYIATYGARSGGANMYDAAETFFNAGGSELVVQRAFGPSAANATVSLSSGDIVVTSRWPGAWYDGAYTAAYTAASKTLTISKNGTNVTYTGTDAASLQSAASVDPDVAVTVTDLPGGNVTATALAGGADDYASVVWATVLDKVPSTVGPAAIAAPGVATAATALAAHAAAHRQLALLTPGQTDSAATVISAQGAIAGSGQQYATYCYPWIKVADGVGGEKVIDSVGYVAGLRAITQRVFGVGESPLRRAAHQLASGAGAVPLTEVDDATHTSLLNAAVATVRTLPTGVGLDVWATPAGVSGNSRLAEAVFRDMSNAIIDQCSLALDQFVGQPGSTAVLADARSVLVGILEGYRPWLVDNGNADPGYKVAVSNGSDPADNRVAATVSVRFSEVVGFVDLTVNAASANQTI